MHGKAFTGPSAELRATRAGHWAKSLAGFEESRDWCAKTGVTLVKAQSETIGTLG